MLTAGVNNLMDLLTISKKPTFKKWIQRKISSWDYGHNISWKESKEILLSTDWREIANIFQGFPNQMRVHANQVFQSEDVALVLFASLTQFLQFAYIENQHSKILKCLIWRAKL